MATHTLPVPDTRAGRRAYVVADMVIRVLAPCAWLWDKRKRVVLVGVSMLVGFGLAAAVIWVGQLLADHNQVEAQMLVLLGSFLGAAVTLAVILAEGGEPQ